MTPAIARWELTACPSDEDPTRHKLRLAAEAPALSALLPQAPASVGKPFATLAKDFNWALFVPSVSEAMQRELAAWLERHAGAPQAEAPAAAAPVVKEAAPEAPAEPAPRKTTSIASIAATSAPAAIAPPAAAEKAPEPKAEAPKPKAWKPAPSQTPKPAAAEAPSAKAEPAPAPAAEPEAVEPAPDAPPYTVPIQSAGEPLALEPCLVELVAFYPENKPIEMQSLMDTLHALSKKFRLRIKLSELEAAAYSPDRLDDKVFKSVCSKHACVRALVLGPAPEMNASEEAVFAAVQAAFRRDHLTLHWVPWSGLSKNGLLLNCALELSLPTTRLIQGAASPAI